MSYKPLLDWQKRNKKVKDGYVIVWTPEHPKCFGGGWYYEHRLVMEKKYCRILKDWETVHHINADKECNEEYNLFVCTRAQHMKAHK